MPDVVLKLGGMQYGGWTSIHVRRSMEGAVDLFELGLTDRWTDQPRPVKAGTPCELWVDKERLVTGFVDEVRPQYDAQKRSLQVVGRAKTADLEDCSTEATEIGGTQYSLTFPKLCSRFCAQFVIAVRDEVGLSWPQDTVAYENSQSFLEFLHERASVHGVRLMCGTDGALLITRTSDRRAPTALKLGENILAAHGLFSMRDRYSHYLFTGQRPGSDDTHGESAAHVRGVARDVVMRYRPFAVVMDGNPDPAEAQRRATWKRNVQYGQSRAITYSVLGWRHALGLWEPNTRVYVVDPFMGIDDWMLIATVNFDLDEQGEVAELTVYPPEAFDLIPLPDEDVGSL